MTIMCETKCRGKSECFSFLLKFLQIEKQKKKTQNKHIEYIDICE